MLNSITGKICIPQRSLKVRCQSRKSLSLIRFDRKQQFYDLSIKAYLNIKDILLLSIDVTHAPISHILLIVKIRKTQPVTGNINAAKLQKEQLQYMKCNICYGRAQLIRQIALFFIKQRNLSSQLTKTVIISNVNMFYSIIKRNSSVFMSYFSL